MTRDDFIRWVRIISTLGSIAVIPIRPLLGIILFIAVIVISLIYEMWRKATRGFDNRG